MSFCLGSCPKVNFQERRKKEEVLQRSYVIYIIQEFGKQESMKLLRKMTKNG